jgi:hypothetical protein
LGDASRVEKKCKEMMSRAMSQLFGVRIGLRCELKKREEMEREARKGRDASERDKRRKGRREAGIAVARDKKD